MHYSQPENNLFYIGVSEDNKKRPRSFGKCRNARWQAHVQNALGGDYDRITVAIMDCQTVDSAYRKEKQLIKQLQPLCNIQHNSKNQKGKAKMKEKTLTVKSLVQQGDYILAKDLLILGNAYRKRTSQSELRMAQMMTKKLLGFARAVDAQALFINRAFPEYDQHSIRKNKDGETELIKPLAFKFAANMSVAFELEMIMISATIRLKAPVNAFSALGLVVATNLPITYGETYKEIMSEVEIAINERFFTNDQLKENPNIWGSEYAKCEGVASRRISIEYKLSQFLKNRLVNNSEHLISIIQSM
jgi:hypothetical protein